MFNELIQVYKPTETVNQYGARKETNSIYKTIYASVKYTSGNVQQGNYQSNDFTNVEFIIRYRNDISIDDQIKYNGNSYKIQFIEPIGRKDKLRVKCISTHLINTTSE